MRTIRTLRSDEVGALVQWAAAEGWNPGIDDAVAFHAADPEGFLGAFVEGKMVAGIAAVAYDDSFGFVGLYICHPAHRGMGHGKAVWDAGIARLGYRTIGLDAVPAQQANYQSIGFEAAYGTIRMTGRPRDPDTAAKPIESMEEIAAIDRICFPAPRTAFLTEWIKPPRQTLALDGGYGTVRKCAADSKIGPLFAPDLTTALLLLGALSSETVSIDVPLAQTEFLNALAEGGFVSSFSTTRMYRGDSLGAAPSQVFGITSLELG